MPDPMTRILVLGPCGAGKSTFARRLAEATGLPLHHMDRLHWRPGWVESDDEELAAKVGPVVGGDRWIIDGNYGQTLPQRLARADTVLHLDFPRRVFMPRLLRRVFLKRDEPRPDMTDGCRERFDAGFLWYAWTFPNRVRPGLMRAIGAHPHVRLVTLRGPAEVKRFLADLPPRPPTPHDDAPSGGGAFATVRARRRIDAPPPPQEAPMTAAPTANGVIKPSPTTQSDEQRLHMLRQMMLLRRFEESTYREYTTPRTLEDGTKEMKIGGFCHLYSGQEAIAVGTAALMKEGDQLINAYRCHGHSLALGMDPHVAMAELFGKATGCSKGKGGSMHLFDASAGNNGGHGIVGGHLPVATGLAFAQQYKGTDNVTFCFFGDGAINQGTHNEALNLASLYKLPVIWVIENNGVAMGTLSHRHSAEPDLAERGSGYNMPHYNCDANDLDAVIRDFGRAVDRARAGDGPSYISANTFRFRGHSMSDPLKYRSKEEADAAKAEDPITTYELKLREDGVLTDEAAEAMDKEIRQIVKDAIKQADADPHPELESRFDDVLSETYPLEK